MIVLVAPGTAAASRVVELDDDEAHHLRVRRARDGDRVGVRDGAGLVGDGLLRLDGRRAAVEIGEAAMVAPPAPLRLAVGAGEKDRFGWLAEKAGELGVTELVPLETARTAGVATRVRPGQLDRLRRRAVETLKQSGAAWAPAIADPVGLATFAQHDRSSHKWVGDASGAAPPATLNAEPLAAVVGPEGGLEPEELALLAAAGFASIRLGPHVLRFETAALAAAAEVAAARLRGAHG